MEEGGEYMAFMIKNVVDQKVIKQIYDRLINTVPDSVGNTSRGDNQVTNNTTSSYFRRLQDIHFKLTPAVSTIFKKDLLPTYDYSRIYTKGAYLEFHRDNKACEYTVSINVANFPNDAQWDLQVEAPRSEPGFVVMNNFFMSPGDAVFYNGTLELHGREKLEYDMCYQTFLHFVDANGSNSNYGWDNYKELI